MTTVTANRRAIPCYIVLHFVILDDSASLMFCYSMTVHVPVTDVSSGRVPGADDQCLMDFIILRQCQSEWN